jgi:hypothetical protein
MHYETWLQLFHKLHTYNTAQHLSSDITTVSDLLLEHDHPLAAAVAAVTVAQLKKSLAACYTAGVAAGAAATAAAATATAGTAAADSGCVWAGRAGGLVLARYWVMPVLHRATPVGSQLRLGYARNADCVPDPDRTVEDECAYCILIGPCAVCRECDREVTEMCTRASNANWRMRGTPPSVCAGQGTLAWVAYCVAAGGSGPVTRALAGLAAGELDPDLALAIVLPNIQILRDGVDSTLAQLATAFADAFAERVRRWPVLPPVIV